LIVQNDIIVALDNDSTVTMLKTSFSYPVNDTSKHEHNNQ